MTLPNFIIIGAAKSGTTALYRYLRQHPDIFMSDRKEPHHFSYTEETKKTNGPSDYIWTAITDPVEYENLFSEVKDEIAVGEASPTYIYVPGTAERIYEKIPNANLIAILRNPVDRAYSAYMHLIRDDRETVNTFKEALALEDERIKNNWGPIYHYTRAGMYYEQLTRYYKLFPKEKIMVIIYDDFKKQPLKIIQQIFEFLGVDPSFVPDTSSKPNVSGVPKSTLMQDLLNLVFAKPNPIRSISRKLFPESSRWRFTSLLRNLNLNRQSMPDEYRQLLKGTFNNDIRKLQSLIGQDLSFWLEDSKKVGEI